MERPLTIPLKNHVLKALEDKATLQGMQVDELACAALEREAEMTFASLRSQVSLLRGDMHVLFQLLFVMNLRWTAQEAFSRVEERFRRFQTQANLSQVGEVALLQMNVASLRNDLSTISKVMLEESGIMTAEEAEAWVSKHFGT